MESCSQLLGELVQHLFHALLKSAKHNETFLRKETYTKQSLKLKFCVVHLTLMHSSCGISNTFSICDSTRCGSAFFKSI